MRFRCGMCSDWPASLFEFEDDMPGTCPKCGVSGPPAIAALVDVHLCVWDHKGPIAGHGRRQRVVCQPSRPHLATVTQFFAATGDAGAVTCPKCKASQVYRDLAAQDDALRAAMEQEDARRRGVVDLGERK